MATLPTSISSSAGTTIGSAISIRPKTSSISIRAATQDCPRTSGSRPRRSLARPAERSSGDSTAYGTSLLALFVGDRIVVLAFRLVDNALGRKPPLPKNHFGFSLFGVGHDSSTP